MNINLKKHYNELLFLPLGGAREIGMNLNLYHYKGKWLMVDLGAGFADDYFPGVDMIVPDISFLKDKVQDLLGIVLTHAHEDHIGAVQYLWEELRCPIYTTPFTSSFLKLRLAETSFAKKVKIHELQESSTFKLDPFEIEMVPITHSTPEMQGLVIRTDLGNVFHTGDWKFDPDPIVGKATDFARLKKYGDEGILALVGDSTNVFNQQPSGSEGELRESLIELIGSCKKMVVVATFASNVARIETILEAAKRANRVVALAGRSLWRIAEAARQSGYLKDAPEFINQDSIRDIPREKLLVIATGCQGEPLAATTKMAFDSHNFIRLNRGDNVIFSSKIIPGNDKKIFRVFNQFVHMGVEVFTEKDHFVHVSGHPSSVELKQMYELIRPQVSVPVHGELVHMHEHARLAKIWGVPSAIQVENGVLSRLAPGEPENIAVVPSGYLGVDGNYLLSGNSGVMKMRRKLAKDGIVLVFIITDQDGIALRAPIIKAPGVLDAKEDDLVIREIEDEIDYVFEQHYKSTSKKKHISDDTLSNLARQATRRILREEIGKVPVIDVHIERLK